jgi:hypothetical protein
MMLGDAGNFKRSQNLTEFWRTSVYLKKGQQTFREAIFVSIETCFSFLFVVVICCSDMVGL